MSVRKFVNRIDMDGKSKTVEEHATQTEWSRHAPWIGGANRTFDCPTSSEIRDAMTKCM